MHSFDEIISKVSISIEQNELPGMVAHKLMQPYYANAKNFNIPTNPFAKKSAVLILIFQKNNEPHILFIERPANTGVHSGQISFPGGKYEKTDKNYIATALRETYEEVGLAPENINILGKMSQVYVVASNFIIQPVLGFMQETPKYKPNEEVENILEVPLSYLHQASVQEKPIKSAIGVVLQAPYILIENKTLWGVTAMITSELIQITKSI